jgi:hypothetical protein
VGIISYTMQTLLEFRNHCVFDENVFFVQVFDDEGIMVLAVDVDEHSFDGRVALDESTWSCLIFVPCCDLRTALPLVALTMTT